MEGTRSATPTAASGSPARTVHDLRGDALHHAWDNSLAPVPEIDPGDTVAGVPGDTVVLHVRDASDGQIRERSDAGDVAQLDFSRVNPVCGLIFAKGAKPGAVLAVELLEFQHDGWVVGCSIPLSIFEGGPR